MTFARLSASATPGEMPVWLLEIATPSGDVFRYANDYADWEVTLEGGGDPVTFPAALFASAEAAADDLGVDERPASVPDEGLLLWHALEDSVGMVDSEDKPLLTLATIRRYLSTDLSAPDGVVVLEMSEPQPVDGCAVSFTMTSADWASSSAPVLCYTATKTPQMRGR